MRQGGWFQGLLAAVLVTNTMLLLVLVLQQHNREESAIRQSAQFRELAKSNDRVRAELRKLTRAVGTRDLSGLGAVYDLLGITRKIDSPNPGDMSERLMLPMVNEAARCLQEEIVRSAADLDLAMIFGTGFPPFRGGLCRWADAQGADKLASKMEQWATQLGDRFKPGDAYRRVIEAGGFYELFPS